MYVIYGLDTKSIEDAEQCVLIDVPDDLDAEGYEEWLQENGSMGYEAVNLIHLIQYLKVCKV